MFILELLREIAKNRDILFDLARKNFRLRYAEARLGLAWTVILPILLALAIKFVFTVVFKIHIENFALFALAGILPWIFFSNSLMEATNSLISSKSLFLHANMPKAVIPLSVVLVNFLLFLISVGVIGPFFFISSLRGLFFLPVLVLFILVHLLFCAGMSLLFSCINVYYRDLTHLLSIGMMIWFWATPVFYPLSLVPEKFRWLSFLNPMTYYVVSYRDILLATGRIRLMMFIGSLLWAIGIFLLGGYVFKKGEHRFIKRI